MRILHVTEDHSMLNTGVTRMVDLLSRRVAAGLGSQGSVRVFAPGSNNTSPGPGVEMRELPLFGRGLGWRWSPSLQRVLTDCIDHTDIVHLHGVWMAPQWMAARIARRAGVPSVFSAHGMLDPWMWSEQGLFRQMKKVVYWRCLAFPALNQVAVVHATTPLEREHLGRLFRGARIEVIPNAVDTALIDAESRDSVTDLEPCILFVGRLHPKKGVDVLVRAFAEARLADPWRLVIAGPCVSASYLRELRRLVDSVGPGKQIELLGPTDGCAKWQLMKRAWVVVVPSHAEAIGLVNLEAAACGTPTITTHQTGLWDWEQGGGLLAIPRSTDLARVIRDVAAWSVAERTERGRASRQLVERRYSAKVVAKLWIDLYDELHGATS